MDTFHITVRRDPRLEYKTGAAIESFGFSGSPELSPTGGSLRAIRRSLYRAGSYGLCPYRAEEGFRMTSRQEYAEEEAQQIWVGVESFMKKLSERLSECLDSVTGSGQAD